jgi:hypothetical protein
VGEQVALGAELFRIEPDATTAGPA